MADLFDPRWQLDELTEREFGPFAPKPVTDEEKNRVWDAYRSGKPTRVPVLLATNDRVALLDGRIDPGGLDYEETFSDAAAMLRAQLLWQYVCRKRYHHFCDWATALPDAWHATVSFQNVYEAWFFGCPVQYRAGQVPDTTPILGDNNKRSIFEIDITRPLARAPFSLAVEFCEFLADFVKGKTFIDRPIIIDPPGYTGTDGPLTVAMNVRGPDILVDLAYDPDYAHDLFAFIIDAALHRRRAMMKRYDLRDGGSGMADDSIALISVEQYRQMILPHHRRWFDEIGSTYGKRSIHLCGDATRHFATIKEELGVTSFDTGYPVDFGALRRTLGPDVEILGGVEVGLLTGGTPQQVYARVREIMTSGIRVGGKFVLREANNLPPNVSWSNLAAMYQAAFDFGKYG